MLTAAARMPPRFATPALLACALAAPALLGVARLLPVDTPGIALRLAAATACVLLLPGALVLRAIGWPADAGTALAGSIAWSLALVIVALAVTFAANGSLSLTVLVLGVLMAAALIAALRARPEDEIGRVDVLALAGVLAAGALFAVYVWVASTPAAGDALFHLARERKLESFDSLSSLRTLDEFRDGGLHPGYAFPLWHGAVALTARLADLDVATAARNLSAILTPLSVAVVFAAGRMLFRSPWAGVAVATAHIGQFGLAPGHGGGFRTLALPATSARHLLVPVVLALAFAFARGRDPAVLSTTGAAALALALVHPTYAVFVAVPLAGFAVARALLARRDVLATTAPVLALAVPTIAVAVWLRPLAEKTASQTPSHAELARTLAKYGRQIDVLSPGHYRLSPDVFTRGGAVAVAALACIPLAGLASRTRWAALVLGGSLSVFALTLLPLVFTHFADAVSLSQARRFASFLPFAFAFAGGAVVLARFLGPFAVAAGAAAGVALQHFFPGDFGYRLVDAGPALATWFAAVAGAVALAAGAVFALKLDRRDAVAALAAVAFVVPVAVHGLARWGPARERPRGVTSGLVHALRTRVPARAVVYSDVLTSYRIAAYAPVYVANAPPGHVADTPANRPRARWRDSVRFFKSGNVAIPHRYGATWIVIDKARYRLRLQLPRAYRDKRYVLYRLGV